MKTLHDYLEQFYRMEIMEEKEEGGFVVSFPDLPGCLSFGETVEQALSGAKSAKKAWLTAALEDGLEIQGPGSLEEYSGQFKLRIPRSLHRSLAENASREGISMNQYCVYLLSKNDAISVNNQRGGVKGVMFGWDGNQEERRMREGRITLKQVADVFQNDVGALLFDDPEAPADGQGLMVIGRAEDGQDCIVGHCCCNEDDVIMILSAREATKKEEQVYWKWNGGQA